MWISYGDFKAKVILFMFHLQLMPLIHCLEMQFLAFCCTYYWTFNFYQFIIPYSFDIKISLFQLIIYHILYLQFKSWEHIAIWMSICWYKTLYSQHFSSIFMMFYLKSYSNLKKKKEIKETRTRHVSIIITGVASVARLPKSNTCASTPPLELPPPTYLCKGWIIFGLFLAFIILTKLWTDFQYQSLDCSQHFIFPHAEVSLAKTSNPSLLTFSCYVNIHNLS